MLNLSHNLIQNWINLLPDPQHKSKWLKNWKNETMTEKHISTLSVS